MAQASRKRAGRAPASRDTNRPALGEAQARLAHTRGGRITQLSAPDARDAASSAYALPGAGEASAPPAGCA
eukprot:5828403-Alexandrium_andersonii.AAC.1